MQWNEDRTKEVEALVATFDARRKAFLDAMVMQLFCNLHLHGLAPAGLSGIAPNMTADEYAQIASLFLVMEAVQQQARAMIWPAA